MTVRKFIKRAVHACFLLYTFPMALLCGFGSVQVLFTFFAQALANLPGLPGSLVRAAFYCMTLKDCSIDVSIGLGSYFSRRQAIVGRNVSIGSYCVIGQMKIGARSQISSHVEMPGGRVQHIRDQQGRLSDTVEGRNDLLEIGEDCWIGAGAIIMANVGAQSTIGAGSVVVHNVPSGVVAVGSPARPIHSSYAASEEKRT